MLTLFMTISYISMFFWLFPAVRQYRTYWFAYFLILAVADPIGFILSSLVAYKIFKVYIILSLALVLIFVYYSSKRVLFYCSAIFCSGLIFVSYFSSLAFDFDILVLAHIVVLLYILRRTLSSVARTSMVNIFHVVLILYETSVIMKLLAGMTNASVGQFYYLVTNIFQMLIAVFFTIFKEDNIKLHIPIKKVDSF